MKHVFLFFLIAHVQGNASIWEQIKAKSHILEGQIQSMTYQENNREVVVKINPRQGGAAEMIKVCAYEPRNPLRTPEQDENLDYLKRAFAQGETVKLGYESPFNRCLLTIHR